MPGEPDRLLLEQCHFSSSLSSDIGKDLDNMIGQLLRRMPEDEPDPALEHHAVVAPLEAWDDIKENEFVRPM